MPHQNLWCWARCERSLKGIVALLAFKTDTGGCTFILGSTVILGNAPARRSSDLISLFQGSYSGFGRGVISIPDERTIRRCIEGPVSTAQCGGPRLEQYQRSESFLHPQTYLIDPLRM